MSKGLVRLAIWAALALNVPLLAGCALMQPTDPYGPVPGLHGGRLDRQISQHPATPGVPTPIQEPLTIAQALKIALANNPEVAATQWDVAAAENRHQAARAGHWPSLSAEGGYGRFLDSQRLIQTRYNAEPGVFDDDIYRADLVLKLPLFTGGRITNEVHAADLLRLSEERRLARSREELVFNVSSTFYAMLSQREVIRSLEFSTTAMEEHRSQVSDLLAAQKAARVDLLRTEVRLADLRQGLVREQNIFAVQRRLLVNLMGVDDEMHPVVIAGTLLTEKSPDCSAQDLVPTALGLRSDYLAARARLEAQARRVDVARAGHWPSINLVGSYGLKNAPSPEDEGRDTKSTEDIGSIGIALALPIFEGGRVSAKVSEETAALAAARERLRKLELQIRREVETALLDIQSSAQRSDATRQAIEQAKESLRIERMKYELGSGSLTDVLDAQSALLQSETNYARALADYRIATAKLSLATGEDSL